MASIKVVCKKSKVYSDKTSPVLIRVIINRKTHTIQIAKVESRFFDDKKQCVKSSHLLHTQINQIIKQRVFEIQSAILDAERNKTLVNIDSLLRPSSTPKSTLIGDLEDFWVNYTESNLATSSKRTVRMAIDSFASFCEMNKIDNIQSLGKSEVDRYMQHCKNLGQNQNTIKNRCVIIKRVLKSVIDKKELLIKNPFESIKLPTSPVNRMKLSPEQIKMIEGFASSNATINKHKDSFLLQYYLYGTRISDILLLKNKDIQGDIAVFNTRKDKKARKIRLSEKALCIINKYKSENPEDFLLPFFKGKSCEKKDITIIQITSHTSYINKSLKVIGKALGFPMTLTTHIARHSFAFNSIKKTKNLMVVSQALGHAKLTTTEQYLKSLDNSEVDDAISGLFD